jgi:hypothetical protein
VDPDAIRTAYLIGAASGVTAEAFRVLWDNTGQRVLNRRYAAASSLSIKS